MERRQQVYPTDTKPHSPAHARDRLLRRRAEDALDVAELRALRDAIAAEERTALDSPRSRLRRWLAEPIR